MSITRIPRPLGASLIPHSPEKHKQLIKLYVHNYIANNYTINGKYTTLQSLAQYLNTDIDTIQRIIYRHNQKLLSINGLTDDKDVKEVVLGLIGEGFRDFLNDRSLITEQVMSLRAFQQGTYVPYATSEYNKALKLLLDSQQGLRDLIKMISSGSQNITFIDNRSQTLNQPQTDSLTHAEALKLIGSQKALTPLPEHLNHLSQIHGTEAFPDVHPLTQGKGYSDEDEARVYQGDKLTHENRREIEFEVSEDDDGI